MIRQGGSYVRERDGTLRQVQAPTAQPRTGNAPRDAEGRRLDRPDVTAASPDKPARQGRDKAGNPQQPADAPTEES